MGEIFERSQPDAVPHREWSVLMLTETAVSRANGFAQSVSSSPPQVATLLTMRLPR
jgi:hypothetical protein